MKVVSTTSRALRPSTYMLRETPKLGIQGRETSMGEPATRAMMTTETMKSAIITPSAATRGKVLSTLPERPTSTAPSNGMRSRLSSSVMASGYLCVPKRRMAMMATAPNSMTSA